MRNQFSAHILALVVLSILFNIECSYSRRPSLRLKVLPDKTSRDTTRIAPITFHLLDDDPLYIVMNERASGTEQLYREYPKLRVLAGKLNARRFGGYPLGPDVFLLIDQSRPLWEPHIIKSTLTDSEGKSQLDDLKPGNYWLMAYPQAEGKEVLWLQSVTIKEGVTEMVLERGNALYSK
jgi:hypothetical protein